MTNKIFLQSEKGYFGEGEYKFGGCFIPEILYPALNDLQKAYKTIFQTKDFQKELKRLYKTFVGRPTPLIYAKNASSILGNEIYLKFEGLANTGAHKINNALAQVLLAKRMKKQQVIAETGAGQHGVAVASVCAFLKIPCTIFMGATDIQRQRPNVFIMEQFGAVVVSVESGTKTLKDAVNEALRQWSKSPHEAFYVLGSALGPYPYPDIVRDSQSIIGKEIKKQIKKILSKRVNASLPDYLVACVGGGSNAMGAFSAFLQDNEVQLIGVEAGGDNFAPNRHAMRLSENSGARIGVAQGFRSYFLQDEHGQIAGTHSISAGLDYAGVGPQLAHLAHIGRVRFMGASDEAALEALQFFARHEGILPALESSHALAGVLELSKHEQNKTIVVNVSGRGDKDIFITAKELCAQAWRDFLESELQSVEKLIKQRSRTQGEIEEEERLQQAAQIHTDELRLALQDISHEDFAFFDSTQNEGEGGSDNAANVNATEGKNQAQNAPTQTSINQTLQDSLDAALQDSLDAALRQEGLKQDGLGQGDLCHTDEAQDDSTQNDLAQDDEVLNEATQNETTQNECQIDSQESAQQGESTEDFAIELPNRDEAQEACTNDFDENDLDADNFDENKSQTSQNVENVENVEEVGETEEIESAENVENVEKREEVEEIESAGEVEQQSIDNVDLADFRTQNVEQEASSTDEATPCTMRSPLQFLSPDFIPSSSTPNENELQENNALQQDLEQDSQENLQEDSQEREQDTKQEEQNEIAQSQLQEDLAQDLQDNGQNDIQEGLEEAAESSLDSQNENIQSQDIEASSLEIDLQIPTQEEAQEAQDQPNSTQEKPNTTKVNIHISYDTEDKAQESDDVQSSQESAPIPPQETPTDDILADEPLDQEVSLDMNADQEADTQKSMLDGSDTQELDSQMSVQEADIQSDLQEVDSQEIALQVDKDETRLQELDLQESDLQELDSQEIDSQEIASQEIDSQGLDDQNTTTKESAIQETPTEATPQETTLAQQLSLELHTISMSDMQALADQEELGGDLEGDLGEDLGENVEADLQSDLQDDMQNDLQDTPQEAEQEFLKEALHDIEQDAPQESLQETEAIQTPQDSQESEDSQESDLDEQILQGEDSQDLQENLLESLLEETTSKEAQDDDTPQELNILNAPNDLESGDELQGDLQDSQDCIENDPMGQDLQDLDSQDLQDESQDENAPSIALESLLEEDTQEAQETHGDREEVLQDFNSMQEAQQDCIEEGLHQEDLLIGDLLTGDLLQENKQSNEDTNTEQSLTQNDESQEGLFDQDSQDLLDLLRKDLSQEDLQPEDLPQEDFLSQADSQEDNGEQEALITTQSEDEEAGLSKDLQGESQEEESQEEEAQEEEAQITQDSQEEAQQGEAQKEEVQSLQEPSNTEILDTDLLDAQSAPLNVGESMPDYANINAFDSLLGIDESAPKQEAQDENTIEANLFEDNVLEESIESDTSDRIEDIDSNDLSIESMPNSLDLVDFAQNEAQEESQNELQEELRSETQDESQDELIEELSATQDTTTQALDSFNEIQANEIQANEIQADEIQADEIQADEIQADETKADEIQSNEPQNNESLADELLSDIVLQDPLAQELEGVGIDTESTENDYDTLALEADMLDSTDESATELSQDSINGDSINEDLINRDSLNEDSLDMDLDSLNGDSLDTDTQESESLHPHDEIAELEQAVESELAGIFSDILDSKDTTSYESEATPHLEDADDFENGLPQDEVMQDESIYEEQPETKEDSQESEAQKEHSQAPNDLQNDDSHNNESQDLDNPKAKDESQVLDNNNESSQRHPLNYLVSNNEVRVFKTDPELSRICGKSLKS